MSATVPSPEPRSVVLAPGLRAARILWRILPIVGWSAVAVLAARILGGDEAAQEQVLIVAVAFLTYGVVAACIRELLSPDRPWLRILPVADPRAHRVDTALRSVLFFVLLSQVTIHLVTVHGWSPVLADATRVLRNLVVTLAAFILIGTTGFYRWLRQLEGDSFWATVGRFLARVVFPAGLLTLLVWAAVRGFGYYPLAEWVLRNAAMTLLKILLSVLLYRAVRRALYRTARFYVQGAEEADTGEGEMSASTAYALGIVRIALGLLLVGLVVATFVWALQSWDLSRVQLREALDVVVPGTSTLTWLHIVRGVVRVAAVLWVGWLLRSIFIYFVFPRSHVGVGGRYAILAVLRYCIVALAVILALAAVGVDLNSLSWFFGAAGIGLAFGLQDIIRNFVSGLIMLIERPMRVGDVVQIGTSTGTVEEIRMRGTTLRTFDNTTLLIPNSQMLGERVTNMTHGLGYARVKVPIIAPHDVDTAQMEALLLDAARANEDVLEEPAPFVWLSEFSPSSLDFTLICFTDQTRGRFGVASRVRLAITERMRAAGIEIPIAKQEVYLRGEHRETGRESS